MDAAVRERTYGDGTPRAGAATMADLSAGVVQLSRDDADTDRVVSADPLD
ncbi:MULTISPECIES: hypothetical protein [Streptomyces]|nr:MULTISPECIES: hypothetical protein [Streptomyces]MCC3654652.1 hypothetical protein [Streptomyces sp. S07_1.15]WSQ70958.1 hypothetical protein OG463_05585 [Streptomyces xinghaiensis]